VGELADRGAGILFISSEIEELLGVADRILVLSEGRYGTRPGRGTSTGSGSCVLRYPGVPDTRRPEWTPGLGRVRGPRARGAPEGPRARWRRGGLAMTRARDRALLALLGGASPLLLIAVGGTFGALARGSSSPRTSSTS